MFTISFLQCNYMRKSQKKVLRFQFNVTQTAAYLCWTNKILTFFKSICYNIQCSYFPMLMLSLQAPVKMIVSFRHLEQGQTMQIPYSGLFSRGVNFPESLEWTRDSGNFILD